MKLYTKQRIINVLRNLGKATCYEIEQELPRQEHEMDIWCILRNLIRDGVVIVDKPGSMGEP